MNDTVRDIAERARAAFPGGVSEVREALGEITVLVEPASITEIALAMKDEHGFDLLADLCGVDRGPEEDPRFEVNYHLFSTTHYGRIRLKVRVPEDDASVPTVTGIWATANWHERETFDLFGIRFDGHPDLRRILLPSDFDGHALRKDYPLRGYEPYSMN